MATSQGITLGYWHFRGRAQPIRYLLEYLNEPYTEKVYINDEEHKKEWFQQDKLAINMEYPNLP